MELLDMEVLDMEVLSLPVASTEEWFSKPYSKAKKFIRSIYLEQKGEAT